MIHYCVRAAKNSGVFERVLVSTDSDEIRNAAIKSGASDCGYRRPPHLASDKAKVRDGMRHIIQYLEREEGLNGWWGGEPYDYVALVQPTSPLTSPRDYKLAIKTLVAQRADMIVGVTETWAPLGAVNILPRDLNLRNFLPRKYRTNRQNLPQKYQLTGGMYMGTWDVFRKRKDWYERGVKTIAYIMPKERSIDIDDWTDARIAEALLTTDGYLTR